MFQKGGEKVIFVAIY